MNARGGRYIGGLQARQWTLAKVKWTMTVKGRKARESVDGVIDSSTEELFNGVGQYIAFLPIHAGTSGNCLFADGSVRRYFVRDWVQERFELFGIGLPEDLSQYK